MPEVSGQFEVSPMRGTPPYPRGGLGVHIYLHELIHKCETCVEGLQAIQVVFATLEHDWGEFHFEVNGKKLQGFVDRGRNSPWQRDGRPTEDKSRPYYLLYEDMKRGGMDTSKGEVPNRLFDFYDAPITMVEHEQAFFETAVICRNFKGQATDKVVRAYRWGWVDYGARYKPRWDATANRLEVIPVTAVSAEFITVLRTEYAAYADQFIATAE